MSEARSVEDAIQAAGGAVAALRREAAPQMTFLPWEFTNWHHEVTLWREAAAFLDQSHHMVDLIVRGPDALRLFSELGVNDLSTLVPGSAKQYVVTAPDGHLIADGILFHLEPGVYDLVGLPTALKWIEFQIETGDYDVEHLWDDNSWLRQGPPQYFRYEVQGPAALEILSAALDGPLPQTRFFGMATATIAGRQVWLLRHGMAGQPGFEIFGRWVDGEAVRDVIFEVGTPLGLDRVGYRAYITNTLESAWISLPVPAIYDSPETKAYRQWLPAGHLGSLAGSFARPDIRDYYVTPYDIGYGKLVSFEHDFVGREALRELASAPARKKVTLHWNGNDVADIYRAQFVEDGTLPPRLVDVPKSRGARFHYDSVLVGGRPVGVSVDTGFIEPDRAVLSLAMIDAEHAEPGTEVTVRWGEPEGSTRPHLPAHSQVDVRATVLPAPYNTIARTDYRQN
ncbi:MAG TPA: aminomethyl transferase family protein [Microbacteriaceae bacterium]|nr:aminomethyl transferase family protein [Microbacteriaceae bacterium]